jgi:hypothetical protein
MLLGVCVSIAGCIGVSRMGLINHETLLLDIEMDAILAVPIGGNALSGGKFSIAGSVIGAYIIQMLTITLYAMKVPSTAVKAYKAIVIIAIVVLGSPVVQSYLLKLRDRLFKKSISGSGGTGIWRLNKRPLADPLKRGKREPISNTNLLLIITVCTFFGMYGMAMSVWGGGFLNPQQFLDLFQQQLVSHRRLLRTHDCYDRGRHRYLRWCYHRAW